MTWPGAVCHTALNGTLGSVVAFFEQLNPTHPPPFFPSAGGWSKEEVTVWGTLNGSFNGRTAADHIEA